MAAYYNEINPAAARVLRDLIAAGEIMGGEVDERPIQHIQPGDLDGFVRHHFFAGIAGWEIGLGIAGWPADRPVWTGSCPCQPFSVAGKRARQSDERHLWPHFYRLICERQPATILGEQVTGAIAAGWLDDAFADLEAEGYACAAAVLPAACVRAPHDRPRVWFVADTLGDQREQPRHGTAGRMGRLQQPVSWDRDWQGALREFRVVDDGLSYGVAATDMARNAIVPQVAAQFIAAYMECRP